MWKKEEILHFGLNSCLMEEISFNNMGRNSNGMRKVKCLALDKINNRSMSVAWKSQLNGKVKWANRFKGQWTLELRRVVWTRENLCISISSGNVG